MKDVKSIGFGFENCEYFSIDAKYFGELELTDFRTSIQRIACNSISKMNLVYSVAIEIFSEGNGKYHPFGIEDEEATFFNRLQKYNDITTISVIYDDDTVEDYYVYYQELVEGQLGSPNIWQDVRMNRFGDLYIVITDGSKSFSSFFDNEEINNEDTIKFAKTMILD